MKLSVSEFTGLRDYIHEKSGIFIKEEKAYFLENRLDTRMNELRCESVEEYCHRLKYDTQSGELNELIEALTTNETFFFRDMKQLNAFAQGALVQVMEEKKQRGDMTLNIWCAGCSTGEEPYTLAMLAEDMGWARTRIIATDINSKVIEVAKRGIYKGRSLKEVTPFILDKYFEKMDDGYWRVNDAIRAKVEFSVLNLLDRARMRLYGNMDFVFCRNVLIYFSPTAAKQVINCYYDSLKKGGCIFLGLAESMHLFSGAFKLVKFNDMYWYAK